MEILQLHLFRLQTCRSCTYIPCFVVLFVTPVCHCFSCNGILRVYTPTTYLPHLLIGARSGSGHDAMTVSVMLCGIGGRFLGAVVLLTTLGIDGRGRFRFLPRSIGMGYIRTLCKKIMSTKHTQYSLHNIQSILLRPVWFGPGKQTTGAVHLL